MKSLRIPLLLSFLFCSDGLVHAASYNVFNKTGSTSTTFDNLYTFQSNYAGITKNYVTTAPSAANGRQDFVQLSLPAQNQGVPPSAIIVPKDPNASIAVPAAGANPPPNRWYGFSIFLPSDWSTTNVTPITFGEIVAAGSGLPAPVSLSIEGEDLKVTLNADHRNPPVPGSIQTRKFTLAKAKPGAWNCVYVMAVWSGVLRQGSMRIYVNGEGRIPNGTPNGAANPTYDAALTHNAYQNVTLTPRAGLSAQGPLAITRSALVDGVMFGNQGATESDFQNSMPCSIVTN